MAEANNNRRVSVDGWGASVTSPVTFEDCRGGVFSQAMSTTVTNCRMENMLLGIHSQLAQMPSRLIFQNNNIEAEVPAISYTCSDRNRGITLLNDATALINVGTNEIRLNRNCTSLLANEGIVFLDIPLADNINGNIFNNNIIMQNWARWGINCDGIRGSIVDNNQMNLSNVTGPAALGLRSNDCERLTVSNNIAFSFTFQASAAGFRTLNSINWNYDCNNSDLLRTGFRFEGFCSSIDGFTANTMGRSNYGLAISGVGTVIGQQTLRGNFWNGTVVAILGIIFPVMAWLQF
nr:hypothetical protein [Bacteroidota bacterium]